MAEEEAYEAKLMSNESMTEIEAMKGAMLDMELKVTGLEQLLSESEKLWCDERRVLLEEKSMIKDEGMMLERELERCLQETEGSLGAEERYRQEISRLERLVNETTAEVKTYKDRVEIERKRADQAEVAWVEAASSLEQMARSQSGNVREARERMPKKETKEVTGMRSYSSPYDISYYKFNESYIDGIRTKEGSLTGSKKQETATELDNDTLKETAMDRQRRLIRVRRAARIMGTQALITSEAEKEGNLKKAIHTWTDKSKTQEGTSDDTAKLSPQSFREGYIKADEALKNKAKLSPEQSKMASLLSHGGVPPSEKTVDIPEPGFVPSDGDLRGHEVHEIDAQMRLHGVALSGFVYKCGGQGVDSLGARFTSWKRKWVTMDSTRLLFFENLSFDTREGKVLTLSSIKTMKVSDKRPCAFKLSLAEGQVIYIDAVTPQAQERWFQAIHNLRQAHKKKAGAVAVQIT